MKKIRIGNDILIRWAITRNGEAEDFAGLSTLRVSVLDEIGARQKAEYSVSGNTITIQYRGANQKKNGVYSLLLEENRGIDGMVTLDHIEAFELVPHSAYTGGKTCSNIGIETVELSSDIDVAQGSVLEHPYKSLRRLGEYLYEMTFSTLPQYVPSNSLNVGGCTSFVRDGKLYRNLDWKYDETPSFIVRTKDFEGMAFDNSVSDGNMRESALGQLPYRIVDGCNRHGIMGSVHVLYNDFNWHGNGSIPLTKVLYEVLTRVTSMQSIQSELSTIIGDIATTPALDAVEYLLQFVITDGVTTYVLTPTSSGYELVNITANPKLTNFKWVNNPSVVRNADYMQLRPTGVERWNIIESGAELADLRFTKAYEQSDRLSEFIGIDDTDKDSTDAELTAIYNRAHAAYLTRTRDGQLWQTMHSVVYGLNGMEHLWCQENWGVDFVAQGGGGEFEQVQANWNENDSSSKAYIRNKPTIPDVSGLATKTELNQGLETKQNTINDLTTIRSNAQEGKNANDIISSYGDIVTHDTNEFATSEQGAKANTALQPSALDDYRTSSAQDAIDEAIQGDIVAIENKIPSQATSSNQLADKDFVNSSLNSITAFYITKDTQGTQFATKAQLDSTTTFYSGGEVRVPTRNDYCIVLADETKTDPVTGENPTTRYIYQNGWEFQYIVNKTTLTAAQLAAINSGITSGKVTQYDDYATSKQDVISDLSTIRSGAAAGATAYQKPSAGIPSSDIAPNAITKQKMADGSVGIDECDEELYGYVDKAANSIQEPTTEGTNGQVLTTDGNGGRSWQTNMAATPSGDPMHYAYVAADAEYNASGNDITKTAPWGDEVTHKAGYWYLNGLGDLTNDDMRNVLLFANRPLLGYSISNVALSSTISEDIGYGRSSSTMRLLRPIRTTIPQFQGQSVIFSIFTWNANIEVIDLYRGFGTPVSPYTTLLFYGCVNLKFVVTTIDMKTRANNDVKAGIFYNCVNLEYIHIKSLVKTLVSTQYCGKLRLESIVFMVENAANTSPISITLHADAYARCVADTTEYTYEEQTYTGIIARATAASISIVSV